MSIFSLIAICARRSSDKRNKATEAISVITSKGRLQERRAGKADMEESSARRIDTRKNQ